MSQRKRIGCILDRFDPELDPGNISQPMGKPKAPPICHCPPPSGRSFGWDDPVIDRDNAKVVCRTCQREIGPGCRRRQVVHLRGPDRVV